MKVVAKWLFCSLVICAAAVVFAGCGNPWMKRITASLYDKPVTPGIPEVPALTGSDKAIMAFDIMSPVNATGFIDEAAKTIAVIIPYSYGTAVTSLTPNITHTGASVSPASDVAQDFTDPVSYTVTAADGSTETYTVTVTVASASDKAITGFKIITSPVSVGVIDEATKIITVIVPYSTTVTGLTTDITHTGDSINPASGAIQDFTNPVPYIVTAADSSTETYTVKVTAALNPAKAITGFNIISPSATGVIDEAAKTIAVTVPYATAVTSLVPTITLSPGASVSPASGVPQNFTSFVSYTVTAADDSTVTYTVTVTAVSVLNSVADVITYLNGASGGTSASTPIVLPPLDIDLAADWTNLLTAIDAASKYVSLDLSACGMMSGTFNPGAANTGEKYVTALTLPDEAASIAAGFIYSTFRYFSSLREVNGEQVTDIGQYAFAYCTNLTSVNLPAVTTIGNQAFAYCTGLTSVNLPASLSNIDGDSFAGCTGLTNISVDVGNPNFSASGGMLMNKAGTTLIAWPSASGSVTLNGITTIGDAVFFDCTSLTSITLPEATTIGDAVFFGCTSLTSVTLPEATTIGDAVFFGCTSLTSVTLPEATTIGSSAFSDCNSLTSVILPEATTIGHHAFNYCNSLTSVTFPAATTIGDQAFESCISLTSVTLSEATTIGDAVFFGCTSLTSVTLPAATDIGEWAFAYSGTLGLTVTLGAAPPALGTQMFNGVTSTKYVTVKVPIGEAANYDSAWQDSFKGGNANINLSITTY